MSVKIKKGREMMQIPVVPLVDTVFNLLIFFLVATKVAEAEKELHVALPYATQAQALTVRPAELIINIDQKGHFFIGSQPATLHELNIALRNASAATQGRTPVTLRCDKRCPSDFLVQALDCCERNKVRQYHLTSKDTPGEEK